MKKCNYCLETKPIIEFHRDCKSKDNHRARCRDCNKATKAGNAPRIAAKNEKEVSPTREITEPKKRLKFDSGIFDYLFEVMGGSYSISHAKNKFIIHKHGSVATLWKGKTPEEGLLLVSQG